VAAYENHVRRENAELPAPEETSLQWPTRPPIGATGESGRLLDVVLTGVTEDNPPVLASPDLTITVSAWLRRGEPPPHLGVLIERTDGVWVYGVATHLEARAPTQLDEQRWQACVRFPRVPLLSGEYGVSAYLLDSTGLVTYEEWLKCRRFDVVTGSHKVGMVELPHEWL
jgi:lipopolysaccharide transport system ATP-binding protein